MKASAEDIQTMTRYDLTKLQKTGPTEEQQRLMDKRRQVIADEPLWKKAIAERPRSNSAANDTTNTTGKHPNIRIPLSPRPPRGLFVRKGRLTSKREGEIARAKGDKIRTLQYEIQAEILRKGDLIREKDPDAGQIRNIQDWIDRKQDQLKELQGKTRTDLPPSPTGAVVGSRPGPPPLPGPQTPPGTPRGKSRVLVEPATPPVSRTHSQVSMGDVSPPASPRLLHEAAPEATEDVISDGEGDTGDSASEGSEREFIGGDEDQQVAAQQVQAIEQNAGQQQAIQQQLPWDIELPSRPLMKFRPTAAPINDEGNAPFFHTQFLHMGGARRKVGIPGGYMLLRPKHVDIVVERLTYATRHELSNFLHGRFPMGGVINKQSFSNADLPLAVFRHLPGKVTVTY